MENEFKKQLADLVVSETLKAIENVNTKIEYDNLFLRLSNVLFKINETKNTKETIQAFVNGDFDFINSINYSDQFSDIISNWLKNKYI